jgi:hypothetical protein
MILIINVEWGVRFDYQDGAKYTDFENFGQIVEKCLKIRHDRFLSHPY